MEGNIVGEPFEDFVANQIRKRQSNQFSGYGTPLRTDDQLKYLNNRNAWVKLASSVDVLQGDTVLPITQVNSSGQTIPAGSGTGFGVNVGFGTGGLAGAFPSPTFNTQTVQYKSEKLELIGIPPSQAKNYAGSKFAEKAVLFNTLSSFDPISNSYSSSRAGISDNTDLWNSNFAYGLGGTEYGIQPPPGITGVTVDSLNRGSIRKAAVTLKAHNKFQFDVIELLYLRLGFTMMLEWGWDKYLDNDTGEIQQVGNTIIEEKWFTSKNISQLEMLSYIQTKRSDYDGNYDGFFGKVSNFTWNFNPDGSYDISIDLITLGDVIESLKVNTTAKQKLGEFSTFTEEDATELERLFGSNTSKASTLNSLGAFLFAKIEYMVNQKAPGIASNNGGYITLDYISILPDVPKNSPQIYDTSRQFYYVKLGVLLKVLQDNILPQIQNGNSIAPQIYISYDEFSNKISYFPNQIPLDPRVCVFKIDDALNSYGDITGVVAPSKLQQIGGINLDPYLQVNQGVTCGSLMNLYMNIEFISELLVSNGGPNQELFLFKFLQDLCNGINDALGGVNKLEPVIKDDSTIVIIDQTLSISVDSNVDAVLEVYGYNPGKQTSNFVKDIKFVSKITPQLASTISIGATAAGSNTSEIDGTAFSKWSDGLVDRFTEKIIEPTIPPTTPVLDTADQQRLKTKFNSFPAVTPSALQTVFQNLYIILGITDPSSVKRRITDPYYYNLFNLVMDFNTFSYAASKFENEQKAKGIFRPGDLTNLVDKNYGYYLANAFGGTVNSILIADTNNYNPRQPYTTTLNYTQPVISTPRYFEFNDTFISQGKAAYKNYINVLNNDRFAVDNIASSEIGFIPLSFEVVLDGISGIKIYNKLSINSEFLPSNYPTSLNFIITKVNHNIANNSWDTSLSTISMPVTKPYEYGLFPPTGNTGNTGGGNTGGTTSYPIFTSRGPQPGQQGSLQLLKDLIGLRETSSTSNYGIANRNENALRSTTNVENLTFDELLRLSKLPDNQQNLNRVFAAGKFQVIPSTLEDIKKAFGFGGADKFSKENQEKVGDYLLLNGDTSRAFGLGRYLKGDNAGSEKDLEDAIQAVGQIWASFPIINDQNKKKVGFVATGDGNTAYYGGSGANPKTVKLTIQDIVKYMIQTRINYSGKLPSFIPTYY